MCRSMVDNQSAIAEIRQGKKERREKEAGQKYNVDICYEGCHKESQKFVY